MGVSFSRTGAPSSVTRLEALHDQAKQGHANAQLALKLCFAGGDGVHVDKAKAAQLYGRAAE
jgi:TPR repeat protein